MKRRKLYIMELPQFDYYKIGYSNDPQKRYTNIKTAIPFDINIILTAMIPSVPQIETRLHYKYKEYNINGEWFNLSKDHLSELVWQVFAPQSKYIKKGIENRDNYWLCGKLLEIIKKSDCKEWLDKKEYDFIIGEIK